MPRAHIIRVPARILRHASGNVTRWNTCHGEAPRVRAAFSSRTSTFLKPSLAELTRKGTLTKSMAIIIPDNESTNSIPMRVEPLTKQKITSEDKKECNSSSGMGTASSSTRAKTALAKRKPTWDISDVDCWGPERHELGATIIEAGNSVFNETGGWRSIVPVFGKEKCDGCMFVLLLLPRRLGDHRGRQGRGRRSRSLQGVRHLRQGVPHWRHRHEDRREGVSRGLRRQ